MPLFPDPIASDTVRQHHAVQAGGDGQGALVLAAEAATAERLVELTARATAGARPPIPGSPDFFTFGPQKRLPWRQKSNMLGGVQVPRRLSLPE